MTEVQFKMWDRGDLDGNVTTARILDAAIWSLRMQAKNVYFCIKIYFSFPRRYDKKCKGKKSDDCTPNRWIMENIPNGKYEATVGVRHNNAAFILDMQVNGIPVFTAKSVPQKGKDGKNGVWTESDVVK